MMGLKYLNQVNEDLLSINISSERVCNNLETLKVSEMRLRNESEEFPVFVTGVGDRILTIGISSSEKVIELKERIQKITDWSLNDVKMFYGTKILNDSKLIMEDGIEKESILTCLISLRGGGGTNVIDKKKSDAICEDYTGDTVKFETFKKQIKPIIAYKLYNDGSYKANSGNAGVGYMF